MSQTEVPIQAETPRVNTLDDYASVLGAAEITEMRALANKMRGKTVQMVNSTAVGGGVAEILNRVVPLIQELDIRV